MLIAQSNSSAAECPAHRDSLDRPTCQSRSVTRALLKLVGLVMGGKVAALCVGRQLSPEPRIAVEHEILFINLWPVQLQVTSTWGTGADCLTESRSATFGFVRPDPRSAGAKVRREREP